MTSDIKNKEKNILNIIDECSELELYELGIMAIESLDKKDFYNSLHLINLRLSFLYFLGKWEK